MFKLRIIYYNLMMILNNWERILKLNGYDVQREQLSHPSSIIELISFFTNFAFKDVQSFRWC